MVNINRNRLIEYVGILAVLLSLLFVAFEIRQSNRIAIGNASMEMTQMLLELNRSLREDPEISALVTKLSENEGGLTPTESQMADALAFEYINVWSAAGRAYENGLILEESFINYMSGISAELDRFPGLAPHFIRLQQLYAGAPVAESGLMNRIVEESRSIID